MLPEEPSIREEAELLRSVFQKTHNLEKLPADYILIWMRSVVVTPHSAFKTYEAANRVLDTTVENITGFVQGESKNLVA